MSKRDQLGRGASFSGASGRSARRGAIDRTINGSDTAATALTDLPVPAISENPDNPRNHLRNLDDMVESVRELGVILPIVVATADAYLTERADRHGDLDEGAQYVVVDGHRRLEAARRVGLATIPVRVDNARVVTDEALLEAAFVANYHREEMTELEEANALHQLVGFYKSQTKAAKRLGIAQATLSSKLSLLKLSPELQADVQAGERKVEHVRNLGKLSPEEQKAKADERARAAAAAKTRSKATPPAEDYHGVIIQVADKPTDTPVKSVKVSPSSPETHGGTAGVAPLEQGLSSPAPPDVLPEPRTPKDPEEETAAGEHRSPPTLPYDDGYFIAHHLIRKMDEAELDKVTDRLLEHRQKREEDATV